MLVSVKGGKEEEFWNEFSMRLFLNILLFTCLFRNVNSFVALFNFEKRWNSCDFIA